MTTDLAAGRANAIGNPARLGQGLLALGYPLAIYFGLTQLSPRVFGGLLLALLVTWFALGPRPAVTPQARSLAVQMLPVAALATLSIFLDDGRFLLVLPVLINLFLLFVFARSLADEQSIIERFARLQDPDLSSAEVRHCSNVTRVWCGFFVCNALAVSLLAVAAPIGWWTVYTGFLSYLLIGLLLSGEYLWRRYRFRRFGDGAVDRLVQSFFDDRPGELADTARREWTEIAEKGSVLGLRLVLFVCVWLGRPAVRVAMRGVALYYLATDAKLRAVSRDFHDHVGVPATLGAVYRHIRCFAFTATDRIFLLRGDTHLFEITRSGREYGEQVREAGTGGILVGAHLGSFEALRAAAGDDEIPVSIVAYFHNAAMSNALFESLDPKLADRVIQVEPGSISHVFKIRERVRAGELVAFLGDRPTPGAESVEVDFLGEPARFPTGAFEIAAALGCPVLLIFNLYRDPNRYEVHCEKFAERIELPRHDAQRAKREVVQRYARRLEHFVKQAPDNWSNFYDFWERD